jgi:TRAP-type transport system periplasmic protein
MWETGSVEVLNSWLWDYVEKNSNGRIKISKFYSQSLHKVPELLPAAKKGVAELALISIGYYPAEFPISRGAEWYYRGCDHADTMLYVMRDLYQVFTPMQEEFEAKNNLKVLYFSNFSYTPFLMTKPTPTLGNLKGKKIRAYGIGSDTLNRLGAVPMPIAAPEVQTSLQRGIIDGVFASCFISIVPIKFHEAAPYFIETGAGVHAPVAVVMNMDVWKSLDPELQSVFNSGVKEIYEHAYLDIYSSLIAKCVDEAVADGAKFSTWSPEDIAKAKALVQPAQINEWIEKICPLAKEDCGKMQALFDELIAKYEPGSKLKDPYQVYIEKYGSK